MPDLKNLITAQQTSIVKRGFMKEDELLRLAKEGLCPFYTIINRVSEEEFICFDKDELYDWFNNNCIMYNKPSTFSRLRFLNFDKKTFEPKLVPKELSNIEELYELPMTLINTGPGIYFLYKDNILQYIGQAKNITARIFIHDNGTEKNFDTVYFIKCYFKELDYFENELIHFYRPPLNKAYRFNGQDSEKEVLLNKRFGIESISQIITGKKEGSPNGC